MNYLPAKTVYTKRMVEFDFGDTGIPLTQIDSVIVTCVMGTDPTPNAMIQNTPELINNSVFFLLGGGVAGNYYLIEVKVITSVERYEAEALIYVEA